MLPSIPAVALPLCLVLATVSSRGGAQQGRPIRRLPTPAAISADSFSPLAGVRGLAGGRVVVNDPANQRLLLLGADLRIIRTTADASGSTGGAYVATTTNLIAYRGDSSMLLEPGTPSMVLVDPEGRLGHVAALFVKPQERLALSGRHGMPGFDARGRFVYRSIGLDAKDLGNGVPTFPDTVPLFRADLDARTTDTVALVRIPQIQIRLVPGAVAGQSRPATVVNPLQTVDDWAALSDGTIAVVRGGDYHVDFYRADGSVRRAPKLPFPWLRLGETQKVAILDSVRALHDGMGAAAAPNAVRPVGPAPTAAAEVGARGAADAGRAGDLPVKAPARGPTVSRPAGVQLVAPSELPDYMPPFFPNSVQADREGRLWIRTTIGHQGSSGAIYDVVDASGTLVDRVQVPANRSVVGFGHGVLYLFHAVGASGRLEAVPMR